MMLYLKFAKNMPAHIYFSQLPAWQPDSPTRGPTCRVLTAALLHGSPMDSAQLADALARGVRMERPLGPSTGFPMGDLVGVSNFADLCSFL